MVLYNRIGPSCNTAQSPESSTFPGKYSGVNHILLVMIRHTWYYGGEEISFNYRQNRLKCSSQDVRPNLIENQISNHINMRRISVQMQSQISIIEADRENVNGL